MKINDHNELGNKFSILSISTNCYFKVIICLILLMIVIYITPKFFSFARYVYNVAYEHYLVAKDFYFTSDYLSEEEKTLLYNSWNGNDITFNISNFIQRRK